MQLFKYRFNVEELSTDKMYKLYKKVVDRISRRDNFRKFNEQLRKDILNAFRIDIMKKNEHDVSNYRCNICFKPLELKYDKSKDIYIVKSNILVNGKKIGTQKFKEFQEKLKHTKEKYIKQYGKEKVLEKWKEYIHTKKVTSRRNAQYKCYYALQGFKYIVLCGRLAWNYNKKKINESYIDFILSPVLKNEVLS